MYEMSYCTMPQGDEIAINIYIYFPQTSHKVQCNDFSKLSFADETTREACESSTWRNAGARTRRKSTTRFCRITTRRWNIRCQRFASTQLPKSERKLNTRTILRRSAWASANWINTFNGLIFVSDSICLSKTTRRWATYKNTWSLTSASFGCRRNRRRKSSGGFGRKIIWKSSTRHSRLVDSIRMFSSLLMLADDVEMF